VLDRGPSPEDGAACDAFRELWGARAELRQFKDGTIVEAVAWENVPRKRIPQHVLAHLAAIHAPFSRAAATADRVRAVASYLEELDDDDAERDAVRAALKAFHDVQTAALNVRKESVPLTPASVRPCCAALRYAAADRPTPHPLLLAPRDAAANDAGGAAAILRARAVPVLDAVLEFERSSKWPEPNTEARCHAETALLVALARALEAQAGVASACCVEQEARSAHRRLVVCTASGHAVRLRVSAAGDERAESTERDTRLHAQLHALHGAAGSYALGAVTRLAKRWVAGQLLSSHVDDETVELLVASLFVGRVARRGRGPAAPRGVVSGLLQLFHLVAHHDWLALPLVVDVSGLVAEDADAAARLQAAAERAVTAMRASDAGPSMAVCTAEDVVTSTAEPGRAALTWRGVGSVRALRRFVSQARKSEELLERLCALSAASDSRESDAALAAAWRGLFHAPPPAKQDAFDAVLHVDPGSEMLRLPAPSAFKNLRDAESCADRVKRALFGFDANAELLARVRGAGLTRFVDVYCGAGSHAPPYVGLAWNRDVVDSAAAVDFTVAAAACAEPVADGDRDVERRGGDDDNGEGADGDAAEGAAVPIRRVRVNKAQVLDEFARVGAGYVVRVVVAGDDDGAGFAAAA